MKIQRLNKHVFIKDFTIYIPKPSASVYLFLSVNEEPQQTPFESNHNKQHFHLFYHQDSLILSTYDPKWVFMFVFLGLEICVYKGHEMNNVVIPYGDTAYHQSI